MPFIQKLYQNNKVLLISSAVFFGLSVVIGVFLLGLRLYRTRTKSYTKIVDVDLEKGNQNHNQDFLTKQNEQLCKQINQLAVEINKLAATIHTKENTIKETQTNGNKQFVKELTTETSENLVSLSSFLGGCSKRILVVYKEAPYERDTLRNIVANSKGIKHEIVTCKISNLIYLWCSYDLILLADIRQDTDILKFYRFLIFDWSELKKAIRTSKNCTVIHPKNKPIGITPSKLDYIPGYVEIGDWKSIGERGVMTEFNDIGFITGKRMPK